MDRKDLNMLDMKTLPPWARTIVERERCRRKNEELKMSTASSSRSSSSSSPSLNLASRSFTRGVNDSRSSGKAATTNTTTTTAAATAATAVAATVTTVRSTFQLKRSATKADSSTAELKKMLQGLDRRELNMIDMRTIPPWARTITDQERCRRKKKDKALDLVTASAGPSGGKTALTAKKKARGAAAVTAVPPAATITVFSRTSSACNSSDRTIGALDKSKDDDTGNSDAKVIGTKLRKLPTEDQNKNTEKTGPKLPEVQRTTVDGFYLHDQLVMAAAKRSASSMWDCNIVYDHTLRESYTYNGNGETRTRDMFGRFNCTTCYLPKSHRARSWHSAEVFTEFWYSHTPATGRRDTRDTLRYQSLIHSQKCRGCEKYMEAGLDRENYVNTAIKAFELWTARRDRLYQDGDLDGEDKRTKPHDTKRCHGCIMGLHHHTVDHEEIPRRNILENLKYIAGK
ncbi:hypothetical protein BGZ70_002202 [Mortierella alpina]|uniref:3CxxC-type domain-containing protein n=1 Tax=Mortierella alpina TaxID=64518 RepID=A0A9P6LXF1_MORAP|nr:hypothetical protein BGZ70_002202 [Mortierella alpina]